MRRAYLLTLLMALCAAVARPQVKDQADEAYADGDYEQAVELYEQLLQREPSAAVYYNLGNAYFRLDDVPHAILAYERALALDPGDDDARFNLQVANAKTVDKIAPEREMFFVTWYRSLVHWLSIDAWARLALVALALAALLALVYLFSSRMSLRKAGFYGAAVLLAVCLLAHVFAWQQRSDLRANRAAIVMQGEAEVMSSPAAGGSKLFTLHAGARVTVTDDSMDDWKQVTLSDGRQGWLPAAAIERI